MPELPGAAIIENVPRDAQRPIWSWALYDWANSAFATTVMAGFFPVFFKAYWSSDVDASLSTFRLGVTSSLASGAVVVLAPTLGAIADASGSAKRFLLAFAGLGVSATAALYVVPQGGWLAAATLFAFASVGFMGGNAFYDSLLVSVASEGRRDRVSALGYALGYLGGGLLFAAQVASTLWPEEFGFRDAAAAVRVAFPTVAAWWAVFALPLFLFVRAPGPTSMAGPGALAAVAAGARQLADTFRHARRLRAPFVFLAAYFLYIDGVDTVIRMAVDYGMSIGLDSTDLIKALLITQFVGFPAALVFGRLGERIGPKRAIFMAIAVYVGVTIWAAMMRSEAEFYALAVVIGLVQGGIQALSRSFYTRLIPVDRAAEFFGFYNMLGKFAAVAGPLLVGGVSLLTGSPRWSILALLVLFGAGALLLTRVRVSSAAVRGRSSSE
jgi:UMF1 family MFS transporter